MIFLNFSFKNPFVRKRNNNTYHHKSQPYEYEIAPTDGGHGIRKYQVCDRGCHIAHKVNKSRRRGHHSGFIKAWAVSAVDRRGRAV
jgi:hypothetical protein